MKENYLWDKTGQDVEIKELETTLSLFRSKNTGAPSLSAKTFAVKRRPLNRFFRFGFAFAGSAAIVFVSIGLWFQLSKNSEIAKTLPGKESVGSKPSRNTRLRTEIPDKRSDERSVDLPAAVPRVEEVTSKPTVPGKGSGIRKIRFVRKSKARRKVRPSSHAVKLTKDEKYAYEQLMLALSITISKLKIVRDKARGIQEEPSAKNGGI